MNTKFLDDDDIEWTREMSQKAVNFSELPEDLQKTLRRFRGPQKKPTKVPTTVRLDADVLDALRATGKGWQTRMNDALREWVFRDTV